MEPKEQAFHKYLIEYVGISSPILELGSGAGSIWLVDRGYRVNSVEHDREYMDKDPRVNYIYAPLKSHKIVKNFRRNVWYDPAYLRDLPHHEVIIIDGPPGCEGRAGFFKYLDLFNQNATMLFDDMQRHRDRELLYVVANRLKRPYYVSARKEFGDTAYGVILPGGVDWVPRL